MRFEESSPNLADASQPESKPAAEAQGRVALDICLFGALIFGSVILYLFLLSAFRSLSSFSAFVLAACCFGINALFLRRQGMTLKAIGLGPWKLMAPKFCLGFGVGLILVLSWLAVTWALLSPSIQSSRVDFQSGLVNLVCFYAFNSVAEEFAYRGYVFIRIERVWGRFAAILGTSLVFAMLHAQGGLPWLSALTVVFSSAMVFAAMFHRWKSLPLAFGVHYAVNIGQDLLGLRDTPLSMLKLSYPEIWPGGGMTVLIAISMMNLILFAVIIRKGSGPSIPS